MILRLVPLIPLIALLLSLSPGSAMADSQVAGRDHLTRVSTEPVPPSLFGMHIHYAHTSRPWPPVSFTGWRLWDAGVSWRYLEPARRNWQFEMLDKYVELARARNVEIVLTLGKTPAWASARPAEATAYNEPGAAAEPARLEDWKNYVRTVAARYKGQIRYYEIWNEPNLTEFFTGTVDQMVILAREAYAILKETDPAALVISPSATGPQGASWLDLYYSRGGAPFADIVGYHFYVTPDPPEAMVQVISDVKKVMERYKVGAKPLWNTESGWARPKTFFNDEETTGYVARSYILNWASGVDRLYWYAWDNFNWVTLKMTERTGPRAVKAAGLAYGELYRWLVGATMVSCSRTDDGIWIAGLRRGDGYGGWIVWHEAGKSSFRIPKEWEVARIRNLRGETRLPSEDGVQAVGPAPVLMEKAAPQARPSSHGAN